jgi:hypothetical protein
MTLTLDLSPEILDGLTRAAIASGISLEDYAARVLKVSVPAMSRSVPPIKPDRQTWIQQNRESRQTIVTSGPALSQTVIELRNGERY